VWGGDAVDVRALTDERRIARTSEIVWSRRPKGWRQVGRGCWRIAADEGGNRQGSPRRARISR